MEALLEVGESVTAKTVFSLRNFREKSMDVGTSEQYNSELMPHYSRHCYWRS